MGCAPQFLVLSFYRVAQEWCRWLTIAKEGGQSEVTIGATTRITEPFAQPFMSATWGVACPPDPADPTKEGPENYHAFITARNPLTGKRPGRGATTSCHTRRCCPRPVG